MEEDDTDTFREVWILANASLAREYGAVIPHTEGLASTAASAEGFLETAVKIAGKDRGKAGDRQPGAGLPGMGRYDEALTDLNRAIDSTQPTPGRSPSRGDLPAEGPLRRGADRLHPRDRTRPGVRLGDRQPGPGLPGDGPLRGGATDFTRAIELDPGTAGRSPGGGDLPAMGRYDEALTDLTRVPALPQTERTSARTSALSWRTSALSWRTCGGVAASERYEIGWTPLPGGGRVSPSRPTDALTQCVSPVVKQVQPGVSRVVSSGPASSAPLRICSQRR